MRLRRDKAGDTLGRASWRSSFLGDPGANFFCGKPKRGTKKEKSSKKERKEDLWKLTLLMGIRTERGFPQQLEKSLAKDARLFHSSHKPNNKDLSTILLQAAIHLENQNENRQGNSTATLRKGTRRPLPQTPSPARRYENGFMKAETVSKEFVPS